VAIAARPQANGRLSDGVLIQGSVRGWILGMPVLRITTSLVLSPADVDAPRPNTQGLTLARIPRSFAGRVTRGTLADAIQTLSEGAAQLDQARRTGL